MSESPGQLRNLTRPRDAPNIKTGVPAKPSPAWSAPPDVSKLFPDQTGFFFVFFPFIFFSVAGAGAGAGAAVAAAAASSSSSSSYSSWLDYMDNRRLAMNIFVNFISCLQFATPSSAQFAEGGSCLFISVYRPVNGYDASRRTEEDSYFLTGM